MFEGVTEIAEEVPAISDLEGLGRSSRCSSCIFIGTISCNDLRSGMVTKPAFKHL
jgi:hypothetical protein